MMGGRKGGVKEEWIKKKKNKGLHGMMKLLLRCEGRLKS